MMVVFPMLVHRRQNTSPMANSYSLQAYLSIEPRQDIFTNNLFGLCTGR